MDTPHDSRGATIADRADPVRTVFLSRHLQQRIGLHIFGKAKGAVRPGIVYFHGGLFNCGKVEDAADLARLLAQDAVVICVDYPLAPQLHFPDTVEVIYEALSWVWAQANKLGVDRDRLFVAGDQAGGNLAAAVAMMVRDRGLGTRRDRPLRGQVLINPMLDPGQSTLSMQAAEDCPCRQAWADYLPVASDALHPYAAPLHSKRLSGLSTALIVTGDGHPLRDEAELYATRLIAAGVSVQVRRLSAGKASLAQASCQLFHEVAQTVSQFVTDAP